MCSEAEFYSGGWATSRTARRRSVPSGSNEVAEIPQTCVSTESSKTVKKGIYLENNQPDCGYHNKKVTYKNPPSGCKKGGYQQNCSWLTGCDDARSKPCKPDGNHDPTYPEDKNNPKTCNGFKHVKNTESLSQTTNGKPEFKYSEEIINDNSTNANNLDIIKDDGQTCYTGPPFTQEDLCSKLPNQVYSKVADQAGQGNTSKNGGQGCIENYDCTARDYIVGTSTFKAPVGVTGTSNAYTENGTTVHFVKNGIIDPNTTDARYPVCYRNQKSYTTSGSSTTENSARVKCNQGQNAENSLYKSSRTLQRAPPLATGGGAITTMGSTNKAGIDILDVRTPESKELQQPITLPIRRSGRYVKVSIKDGILGSMDKGTSTGTNRVQVPMRVEVNAYPTYYEIIKCNPMGDIEQDRESNLNTTDSNNNPLNPQTYKQNYLDGYPTGDEDKDKKVQNMIETFYGRHYCGWESHGIIYLKRYTVKNHLNRDSLHFNFIATNRNYVRFLAGEKYKTSVGGEDQNFDEHGTRFSRIQYPNDNPLDLYFPETDQYKNNNSKKKYYWGLIDSTFLPQKTDEIFREDTSLPDDKNFKDRDFLTSSTNKGWNLNPVGGGHVNPVHKSASDSIDMTSAIYQFNAGNKNSILVPDDRQYLGGKFEIWAKLSKDDVEITTDEQDGDLKNFQKVTYDGQFTIQERYQWGCGSWNTMMCRSKTEPSVTKRRVMCWDNGTGVHLDDNIEKPSVDAGLAGEDERGISGCYSSLGYDRTWPDDTKTCYSDTKATDDKCIAKVSEYLHQQPFQLNNPNNSITKAK